MACRSCGFLVLLLFLLGSVGGCGGEGAPLLVPLVIQLLTPPTVIADPDHFELLGTGSYQKGPREYSWICTASQAEIHLQADTYLNGAGSSFRLQVLDASGALVHDNTYTAGLLNVRVRAVTRPGGAPGVWTLRFTFTDFHLAGTVELLAHSSSALDPDRISLGWGYNQDAGTLTFAVGWPAGEKTLEVGSGIDSGSVRIQVWDPAAVVVFDQTYTGPLTLSPPFPKTLSGAAGTWTITLTFDDVRGGPTLRFPY